MSSISLSEQMGAMAFVDELRHQQKQVQEHLDLPRRRAEIAAHIRAYYLSNQIAFDDALIEQGVRQVFAHRLMFEAPPLNGFDEWLVKKLGQRGGTQSTGRLILFTAVALAVGGWWLIPGPDTPVYSRAKIAEVSAAAMEEREERQRLYTIAEKHRRELASLQRRNVQQPTPNVSGLLKRAQDLLPANDIRADVGSTAPVSAANLPDIEVQANAFKQERYVISRALYEAETSMLFARRILDVRARVKEMLQDPQRAAVVAQLSDLNGRLAELDEQLEHVRSHASSDAAQSTYWELEKDLYPSELLALQISRANRLISRKNSRAVPQEILEELEMNMEAIQADLAKGDANAAEKKISHVNKRLKASGYWSK
ncbi:DUF6384 family protein [Pseudomonas prosekii]|uniref:DUF6384 family protein n=1 Tax=Pseudomonas prosekii TaxID=1148509 RepID=UPI00387B167D